MSLKEKILSDMKEAMKTGKKKTKDTLRMLLSEIQYAQTASDKSKNLSDNDLVQITSRYKKKLEKSLENYPEGKEREAISLEISIVSRYLPKEASEEELKKVVEKILSESDNKNFGIIMKEAIKVLGPSANAKKISLIIKEKLK